MYTPLRFRWALAMLCGCLAVLTASAWALDINLRGYQGAAAGSDVRTQLQAALDAVGQSGGGTVTIPADSNPWYLSKPVFLKYTNVTLAGEGKGTLLKGVGYNHIPLLLAGIKPEPTITAGHREALAPGFFDASITTTKYGLKTTDGTTRASGAFPDNGFTHGPFEKGKSHWQFQTFTLDLAIKNNGATPLTGTICGVGVSNDIAHPSTVWELVTDPAAGNNVVFKFKTVDGTAYSFSLNRAITDNQLWRLAVQVDLTTGRCCAWMTDTGQGRAMTLSNDVTYAAAAGKTFWRSSYGFFRLGDLTDSVYEPGNSGNPPNWTYCGVNTCYGLRYQAGVSPQAIAAAYQGNPPRSNPDDLFRFFTAQNWQWNGLWGPDCITCLPLDENPAGNDTLLVATSNVSNDTSYGLTGYGYWLPARPAGQRISAILNSAGSPDPAGGTLAIRDMRLVNCSTGILIGDGDVRTVRLSSVSMTSVAWHSISTLGMGYCGAGSGGARDVEAYTKGYMCEVIGTALVFNSDVMYAGSSQRLSFHDITPTGSPYTAFELVGCSGLLTGVGNGPFQPPYYTALSSYGGEGGGPLTLEDWEVDNECTDTAQRAYFYCEGSAHPVGGNALTIANIYLGTPYNHPIIELGDSPSAYPGTFRYLGGDRGTLARNNPGDDPCTNYWYAASAFVKTASTNWYGRVYFPYQWTVRTQYWNASNTYGSGNVVRCGTKYYYSLVDSNLNHTPPSGSDSYWKQIPVQWIDYSGPTDQCHILFMHPDFDEVPVAGTTSDPVLGPALRWEGTSWQKNCHLITIKHPNGGTRQYRCTRSGVIGAGGANEPQFTAVN